MSGGGCLLGVRALLAAVAPIMNKLVLRCRFTLGDVVLLTAAVRDLHRCCPGRFQTDVRTGFAELWEHNPHLTPLDEYDPEVRVLDCDMPLVEESDHTARHAIHGFLDDLARQLGVPLHLTGFGGDIHLSPVERDLPSLVVERTGQDIPYWLLNAGGKYDCTVKWWRPDRFQEVVDHFAGRIQFVQVGRLEHWHPALRGVVDLRGRTSVRELVRLVHHAQGVLCGVTALMHLAAAVPRRHPGEGARPAVVIAGGREPPHWEAYPAHQFLHTVGLLPCCASTGCWKSRTVPLGDGDDVRERLCENVRGSVPACMDLITADDVVRRLELCLAGGQTRSLDRDQAARAAQAVGWSDRQPALPAPVSFHTAPQAAAEFIARIPPCPPGFTGRGIVICGGGARMFSNAWVCIRMLRQLGCTLPIELWHLGPAEMDATMEALVRPWQVTCVDASSHRAVWPARITGAWPLKPFAIVNSRFAQVLLLDADNVPVRNPEYLFDHPQFRAHGALLWPDTGRLPPEAPAWRLFDVTYRDEPEVESGQVLVDKQRCWAPLLLCLWYNEHHALFYRHIHGDKETFHFAFRRLGLPYAMIPHALELAEGAFYQSDPDGQRVFQHRNGDKWDLLGRNRSIPGFQHEAECRGFLRELAQCWDGRLTWMKAAQSQGASTATVTDRTVRLEVVMAGCVERAALRAETLRGLARAGWPSEHVRLVTDERRFAARIERLTHTAWRALRDAAGTEADYVLFLEDDLAFNLHLMENLRRWGVLARRELEIGSLCNLGARELAWDVPGCAYLVHPQQVRGSQAVLLSWRMVRYCLDHWSEGPPDLDLKLGFLAASIRQPYFLHCPSLVQHVGRQSLLGHIFYPTTDFDAGWKAGAEPGVDFVAARAVADRHG